MAAPVPWKVPALILLSGIASFILSLVVGVRGPHGPHALGLFLLLASLLLIPAGWIWFVTAMMHARNARRRNSYGTAPPRP